MNIAVASENGESVAASAEACHRYLVYEIVDGEVHNKHLLALSEREALGKFDLLHEDHPLDGVRVLISAGMKKDTERKLKKIGITGLVTKETSPDAAVLHFLDGKLPVEPAGHQGRHYFKEMDKQKDYVPMAGVRQVGDIV